LIFDGEENSKKCPRCGNNIYIKKLNKRGSKKIQRKRLTGDSVKVGGERCRPCLYCSEETTTSATVKCVSPKPETTFNRKKNAWMCYSFKAGNICKKNKNEVKQ